MKSQYPDRPYSLANSEVHKERVSLLCANHIAPLTRFVDDLKKELGPNTGLPYFDPLDGGRNAKLLIVLETPGPKAVGTNFVSRNNPDPTAKNLFLALEKAGLRRKHTIVWNVVPWNLSSEQKSRNPKSHEVRQGTPYLLQLINYLPQLKAVVLCGANAKKAADDLRESIAHKVFETYHFSGQAYNHRHLQDHIHSTLAQAAALIE